MFSNGNVAGGTGTAMTFFLDAGNVNLLWEVLTDELGISNAITSANTSHGVSAANTMLKRNVQQVFQQNLQWFARQPQTGGTVAQYNRQFLTQVTQALRQLNVIGAVSGENGALKSGAAGQHRLTIGEELAAVPDLHSPPPAQSERNAARFTADLEQKQREFDAFANPTRPAEIDFTRMAPPTTTAPFADVSAPVDALVAGKLAERDLENAAFHAAAAAAASASPANAATSVELPPALVPQETAIKTRPGATTHQQQQHVKWLDEQLVSSSQPRLSIFDKLKQNLNPNPNPNPNSNAHEENQRAKWSATHEKDKMEKELAEMQALYEPPPKITAQQIIGATSETTALPPPPSAISSSVAVPKPPPPPPLLPFEEWAKQMNAMRDEIEQLKRRVEELEQLREAHDQPPPENMPRASDSSLGES